MVVCKWDKCGWVGLGEGNPHVLLLCPHYMASVTPFRRVQPPLHRLFNEESCPYKGTWKGLIPFTPLEVNLNGIVPCFSNDIFITPPFRLRISSNLRLPHFCESMAHRKDITRVE